MVRSKRVTERMFYEAALALAGSVTEDQLSRGMVFPNVEDIKHVSLVVATAVAQSAIDDGIARHVPNTNNLMAWIKGAQWISEYRDLIPVDVRTKPTQSGAWIPGAT